jgi:hypothetical protein
MTTIGDLIFWATVLIALIIVPPYFWRVYGGSAFVKRLLSSDADVMSYSPINAPADPPSSLQTDDRRTPDRPMIAKPTPEEMLDIFKVLRAAGVKREALAGPWRAAGLPLDTNLWSKAMPEEPPTLTPIAQRPTPAKFHDDPELEYEPLR